jgi:hypothetical protein
MTKATCLACLAVLLLGGVRAPAQDAVSDVLQKNQWDLATDGRTFLLKEASNASFLLLGGLHGDRETPALEEALWPTLRDSGYRYVIHEMSPWAAGRLNVPHIRGGDIEEPQPHLLIRDLAAANPRSRPLQVMVEILKDGYQRKLAPDLLQLARQIDDVTEPARGPIPLKVQVSRTLEVEVARLSANRQPASVLRETFMKELFATYYRAEGSRPKVMAVYGQNHLGRGIDRRGVSTLGNFIAEFAIAERTQSFHVELFAAGGKILYGGLINIDQRKDEQAFDALASAARYPATVFDLRPLRSLLRRTPVDRLSTRDASLLYSADAYDAIVCYREVTPGTDPRATK